MKNNSTRIKRFRLSLIIAILTIMGAGSAVVLSLLKIIDLTRAEEIIVTLIGLIAIDALIERLHILEKIALSRGASFKFRVLIISHEAFLNSLDGKIDPQFIEKELLKKVLSSLGNELDKTALQAFYNKLSLCL